jgi:hypothetical protein
MYKQDDGYSKTQLAEIRKAFEELKVFRGCKAVEDYLKKRRAELKV